MIRYSSYGSSNYRSPVTYGIPRDPLAEKYEELLELRARLRTAEAQVLNNSPREAGDRKVADSFA